MKILLKKLWVLLILLWASSSTAASIEYICEPLFKIDLSTTTDKPANPIYIPLFQEAQNRYDATIKLELDVDNESSAESLCGISYDCGPEKTDQYGNTIFKECQ